MLALPPVSARMRQKTPESRTVTLELASRLEMLEMVQTVLSHLAGSVGFDDDATHYMSVAVRESVVNAMKHGNKMDEGKRVSVVFTVFDGALEVRVHDQGGGFDPAKVPDPLAEENLLKAYGRGIFFMRQFMDEVSYSFPKRGGTVVTMLKKRSP
jgi:serine/threonine-protein kinase RsbW